MNKFYRGVGSLESRKKRRVEAAADRAIPVGEGTPLAHPALGEDVHYQWGSCHESAVRLAEALIADVRHWEGTRASLGPLSDGVLARALACEQLVRFPAPYYAVDESYRIGSELLETMFREGRTTNTAPPYTVQQDPRDIEVFPGEFGPLLDRLLPPSREDASGVPVRYTTAQYEAARQAGGPLFEDWTLRADTLSEWMARRQDLHAALASRLRKGFGALVIDTHGRLARETVAIVPADRRQQVLILGASANEAGPDHPAREVGGSPARRPAIEGPGLPWPVNLFLRPTGLSASEYAATLAAAYLDVAECDGVGEDERMLAAMVEDMILTVVLANESLLGNSLIRQVMTDEGDLVSFADLREEVLMEHRSGEGEARSGPGLGAILTLLGYSPFYCSDAESERIADLVDAWREWRTLPEDVKLERVALLESAISALTSLERSLSGASPSSGIRPATRANNGQPATSDSIQQRLDVDLLARTNKAQGPLIVADLSELGGLSQAAMTGAALLLRLAAERILASGEPTPTRARRTPAIISTEPHEQGWELSGRALGSEALERLAEIGVLDDSAVDLILVGPDD